MSGTSVDITAAANEGDLPAVRRAMKAVPPPSQELLNMAAANTIRRNHLDIFRYLIENGVSVTSGAVTNAAFHANSLEVFQIMYDHRWHAEQINASMILVFQMSPAMSSRSAVEWLLDHGMDPNLPGQRMLLHFIRGNSTPMNVLAWHGARDKDVIDTMELLISRGASLDPFVLENAIAGRGRPIYQLEVMQWLVDHGADVNYPLMRGFTLIFKAVTANDLQLVEFLLRNGADISVRRPRDGMTVLEVARKLEAQQEILDAIEKHQTAT